MERSKRTGPWGSTVLLGSGPAGAVTLEAPSPGGGSAVIIGIHSAAPTHDGQESMECDVLPQGFCYPDTTYRDASEAARGLLAGREEAAWETVEYWYSSHIEGENE